MNSNVPRIVWEHLVFFIYVFSYDTPVDIHFVQDFKYLIFGPVAIPGIETNILEMISFPQFNALLSCPIEGVVKIHVIVIC